MTVAVVTGAARGVGRGIALVLGDAGATVYVTDRETRKRRYTSLGRAVESVAEEVTGRGGRGVPVAVDHRDDTAVEALFQRVAANHGALDLLVANACNGNALPFRPAPFWEQPLEHWENMIDVGVRSHLTAAYFAAPLLMASSRGLVVLTGYRSDAEGVTGGHLFYDLAMHAVSRLAYDMAHDFGPRGVTVIALSPGFTRTEAIAANIGTFPPGADSVERPGRAVRALLEDAEVSRHAGKTLTVAELDDAYGFGDLAASEDDA